MRVLAKSVDEVDSKVLDSEFRENQNSDINDHLIRHECPYCATPLRLIKGHRSSNSSNLLVKAACSIPEFKDQSRHRKASNDVKGSIHLIISENGQESVFIQESGNISDQYVYDEE